MTFQKLTLLYHVPIFHGKFYHLVQKSVDITFYMKSYKKRHNIELSLQAIQF